jgi:hypothetical protein
MSFRDLILWDRVAALRRPFGVLSSCARAFGFALSWLFLLSTPLTAGVLVHGD